MTDTPAASAQADLAAPLGTARTVLFAFTCGALAANLYYAQPTIALIGRDVGLSVTSESLVVTLAQIGYAIGLVALVPLGDVVENRALILWTMAANVVALFGLAFAPSLWALFAAMLVVGATSCAAQMIVPLAATLAPPRERGRVVGNVMTGLLGGILLARPLSSFLAEFFGWRGIFLVSAAAITALTFAGLFALPRRRPAHAERYLTLIASLGRLFVAEPVLRRRAILHAAMFASFSMFWTGVPLVLFAAPFGFSPSGVALFALAGVLGVFAAPVAGRLADRGHTRTGTIAALLVVALSFAIALLGSASLAALLAAAILVDLGVQANLVLSQREIYQLDERIRSRLNAAFMTVFFLGGALGSALTSPVLEQFGWRGLCALGIAFPLLALAYFLRSERAA
ncbi:MFS transporter [Aurantimonas sp. Leaf443]|uniref:MFS transporter n=1 Tax=Aurantimonas sp. Leaf443 TaxID=1736378 RepID=UPI0006F24BEA|nr:MFS transporter [Aurantimonas sp. Leaf443]KQT86062.1 MFS transporter [Aurantimonas sp. Leaf443]